MDIFNRRLRDEIIALRKSIDSIRDQQERHHQQQQQLPIPLEIKFEENKERKQDAENNRQHRIQNSIRKATWAAFVAAAVYAGIAAFQFSAAKESLEVTRKSVQDAAANFRLDERAWVGLNGTSSRQVKADQPILVNVSIVNSGKTPAKNFHSVSVIQVAYIPRDRLRFDKVDTPPQVSGSHAVVFPSSIFITVVVLQEPISSLQLASIRRGDLKIFVFGTLWYEDIFGVRHSTHYCRYGDQGSIDTICTEHNDAD
jgi:hypothetical protein